MTTSIHPDRTSIDPTHRRFGLLDLMILVAATAAGLTVIRWSIPAAYEEMAPNPLLGEVEFGQRIVLGCWMVLGAWPLIASWSLGLLMLRLRAPRPSRRILDRRPGFVAPVAATLGSLFGALFYPMFASSRQPDAWAIVTAYPVGYAVAGAWLSMILGGRWHPSKDAYDRAGRALGVYWIAMIPLFGVAWSSLE